MFSGLRANSVVYVLDKSGTPELKVGQVVSVSNPVPRIGQMPYSNETFVDVAVKVGEETLNFNQLPSQLSIANFGSNMVVSESREAMLAEVEGMKRISIGVLDSVEYHKAVTEACDNMVAVLNPSIAKERETDERMSSMEHRMGGMEDTLLQIQNMLSNSLSKLAPTKNK